MQEENRHTDKILFFKRLCILLYMCMTLFCLIMVWHGFLSCRKKIFTEASATFQDAISKEMNTRLGSIPIKTNRGTLLLSDSISYEEKERWCDQDYLSLNDPNRIFLDSLFRARLADLGMETQTAVRCKRKEKTTISYTDSLFMKKATALKPVIYRKNKNIEDNIELQAFVQIPLSFILKRADSILLFLIFYGLFVGILYGSYKWGIKKLNAVLLEKKVVETKIVEKPVVAFVRSFSKEGTLPFGLQFDKKSGILKYKNLHVTLSGQGLKLFTHLINSQQSVIAPQIIYSQILGNALKKEKIGKAERDAVSAAIVRLRESLAPMPFIQIKSCRGTGYQLIISNPEEI